MESFVISLMKATSIIRKVEKKCMNCNFLEANLHLFTLWGIACWNAELYVWVFGSINRKPGIKVKNLVNSDRDIQWFQVYLQVTFELCAKNINSDLNHLLCQDTVTTFKFMQQRNKIGNDGSIIVTTLR